MLWNHTKTHLKCLRLYLDQWKCIFGCLSHSFFRVHWWNDEIRTLVCWNVEASIRLSIFHCLYNSPFMEIQLMHLWKLLMYIFLEIQKKAKTVAGYSLNGGCSALKFQKRLLLFYSALQVQPHWRAGDCNSRGGKLLPCCWWSDSPKVSAIWEEFTDEVITAFSALCPPTLPFRWLGVGMHHSTSVLNLCCCG